METDDEGEREKIEARIKDLRIRAAANADRSMMIHSAVHSTWMIARLADALPEPQRAMVVSLAETAMAQTELTETAMAQTELTEFVGSAQTLERSVAPFVPLLRYARLKDNAVLPYLDANDRRELSLMFGDIIGADGEDTARYLLTATAAALCAGKDTTIPFTLAASELFGGLDPKDKKGRTKMINHLRWASALDIIHVARLKDTQNAAFTIRLTESGIDWLIARNERAERFQLEYIKGMLDRREEIETLEARRAEILDERHQSQRGVDAGRALFRPLLAIGIAVAVTLAAQPAQSLTPADAPTVIVMQDAALNDVARWMDPRMVAAFEEFGSTGLPMRLPGVAIDLDMSVDIDASGARLNYAGIASRLKDGKVLAPTDAPRWASFDTHGQGEAGRIDAAHASFELVGIASRLKDGKVFAAPEGERPTAVSHVFDLAAKPDYWTPAASVAQVSFADWAHSDATNWTSWDSRSLMLTPADAAVEAAIKPYEPITAGGAL